MSNSFKYQQCRKCKHQGFSTQSGSICNITKQKPNYVNHCSLFEADPDKERFESMREKERSNVNKVYWGITSLAMFAGSFVLSKFMVLRHIFPYRIDLWDRTMRICMILFVGSLLVFGVISGVKAVKTNHQRIIGVIGVILNVILLLHIAIKVIDDLS